MTTPRPATDAPAPRHGTRRRLGILQTGRSPEVLLERFPDYNRLFIELLGEESFDYLTWAVLDGELPASIEDADAWLITGSRHGTYEDHAWIPPLEAFIRAVYDAGSPMVGICFGHQIIAQAMGGRVEKFSGGWSVGRVDYQLDPDVFGNPSGNPSGTPSPADDSVHRNLMAFHQDQVVELPAAARNVGSSSFCQHAALLYDNRMLTLQPHPEFDRHFVGGLLDARGSILPVPIMEHALATLNQPIDNRSIARILREFLLRQPAAAGS